MGSLVLRWVAVAAYMALIFTVSAFPMRSRLFESAQKFHGDWLVHIVEYGVLGILLCRALAEEETRHGRRWLVMMVMALGILYGASDEYHQRFVPTRDSSLHDLAADTVGVALGTWMWLKYRRKAHA